jgi:hypothetical protein
MKAQNHCIIDDRLLMGREELRTIGLLIGGFSWEYESSELLLRRREASHGNSSEPLHYLQNSSKVRKCCSGYISEECAAQVISLKNVLLRLYISLKNVLLRLYLCLFI